MIRATVRGTTLKLQGHAGAAACGQDLICAAVTGLAYALAQRLTELELVGAFKEPPVICLKAGDALITAFPKEEHETLVQENFNLIQSGLQLLQAHYPNHIKVSERKEK